MIAIQSLGQEEPPTVTYFRPMALQKAVTAILGEEPGFESFPGTHYTIDAATVNRLGIKVAAWANDYPVKWKEKFTVAEGEGVVRQRGYSDTFPQNVIDYYGGMPPPPPGYTPAAPEQAITVTPGKQAIIQDAVTAALQSFRMQIDPEGFFNVSEGTLARVSEAAFRRAFEVGSQLGYFIGYREVSEAVLQRGYKTSELNPFTRQPIEIPQEPLLETFIPPVSEQFAYQPAPIRLPIATIPQIPAPLTIDQPIVIPAPMPLPAPMPVVLPAAALPEVAPEEREPGVDKKWLIVAGLAAILLTRAA